MYKGMILALVTILLCVCVGCSKPDISQDGSRNNIGSATPPAPAARPESGAASATGERDHSIRVTLNAPSRTPRAGKHTLDVTVLDSAGRPITGAKVGVSVGMANMDMGTANPRVSEGKDGHYTAEVEFKMQGAWRVTLTVAPPNLRPSTQNLDFAVSE